MQPQNKDFGLLQGAKVDIDKANDAFFSDLLRLGTAFNTKSKNTLFQNKTKTCFFFKRKHKKKIESLFSHGCETTTHGELTLLKIIAFHNKEQENFINYCNLYSSHLVKKKPLDIDTFSGSLWNLNKDSRFGSFEQVSDNALFKFKKRYTGLRI